MNKKVKRGADVVGIFVNEGAIIWLIGAVLMEVNDEWQTQNRYMQTEAMAELATPLIDAAPTQIRPQPHDPQPPQIDFNVHHVDGRDQVESS